MAEENEAAVYESLRKIKDIEPHRWLIPSPSRSELVRTAAQQIFSILKPYAPKSPFDQLLVDGFDAEQIWQQIDLQSQPLLASLRREVKRYKKNPDEIAKLFGDTKEDDKTFEGKNPELENEIVEDEDEDDMRELDEDDMRELDEDEEYDEEENEELETDDVKNKDKRREKAKFEDEFLKKDELEEFLEQEEERGSDDEEGSDELLFAGGTDDDEDDGGDIKFNDFFGSNKKKEVKRKFDLIEGSEDSQTEDEDEEDGEEGDEAKENKKLSTHQKNKLKYKAEIVESERRLLEPKTWTLQGEVTATQRPKNSALEVDLDFEHNVRPAPVITEEVTLSLEDMIKKRILEGRFDDVQRPPGLPTKAPRERKELDETKSKKGLGEIYEDEYVQKTNPDAAPVAFSDELRKEATMLFKKICVKLDALSHFHFAPKPVIEEMSIQSNLPALAMEEVAPVAVSDAAMLAPEEVYDGKGDFKEETELTQAERKRRRANKKRKFKAVAAKRAPKRAKDDTVSNHDAGKEAS